MYYIGIDISKFKHDCAVIDDVGDVVAPSWSPLFNLHFDSIKGGVQSSGLFANRTFVNH